MHHKRRSRSYTMYHFQSPISDAQSADQWVTVARPLFAQWGNSRLCSDGEQRVCSLLFLNMFVTPVLTLAIWMMKEHARTLFLPSEWPRTCSGTCTSEPRKIGEWKVYVPEHVLGLLDGNNFWLWWLGDKPLEPQSFKQIIFPWGFYK